MQLLAEVSIIEWVAGVSSFVVASLVVASLLAVAAHISNQDKHPSKKDVVFRDVCAERENTVGVELKNVKDTVAKLESTILLALRRLLSRYKT
jgi:hypothetical protein